LSPNFSGKYIFHIIILYCKA